MTPATLSDHGNAKAMIDRHGEALRYHESLGWYCYNGLRWIRDDTGEVCRRALDTVTSFYTQAANLEGGDRKRLVAHALRSESAPRVKAMIELACSDERVIATPDSFDRDPMLLNLQNGTFDLKNAVMRPHDPAEMISKLAPVAFDHQATCPRFNRFLLEVMDGNEDLVAFLRRLVGYTLTGDVREHVLPFLYGSGRNGKGTLVRTLQAVMGDYSTETSSGLLLGERDEADPRSGVADLRGVRFASAGEVVQGKRLNEALTKKLTGGDRMRGSFLYRDSFQFDPSHKVWLQGNHKPEIRGTDPAIWARVMLIPFRVSFEGREDRELEGKLATELPGILNWALAGCFEWQGQGLDPPAEVRAATRDYRREMDRLLAFLESECVLGAENFGPVKALKGRYEAWAKEAEEEALPWSEVIAQLKERGCTSTRQDRVRGWAGIRLKTDQELAHV